MGGGASKRTWQRQFHLTSNIADYTGESYQQVFPVWAIAVTYNQRQLAAATSDHKINLWCLVTHQLLISLTGHADTIWRVAYSPDDSLLSSCSADGTVRLWEVSTGLPVMVMPRNHANWVWCLSWSSDGSRFATGGSDGRILVWDAMEAAMGARRVAAFKDKAYEDPAWLDRAEEEAQQAALQSKPLVFWQAHDKSVHQLEYAHSETSMLVSVGAEGAISVWDAETGTLDVRVMGHIGQVTCVSVSPANSELIATGGDDHTVRLWDLKDVDPGSGIAKSSREKVAGFNLPHFTLKGHEGGISELRFSGDGELLASASKDCEVRIWIPSLENPVLCAKFAAHEAWVRDLAWTADQHYLFSASSDGMIFAWQVPKKYQIRDEFAGSKK